MIAAYRDVGTFRGAAAICGTTHKTVKRIIEAHELLSEGGCAPERVPRARNYDQVAELVAERVKTTGGRSALSNIRALTDEMDRKAGGRTITVDYLLIDDAERPPLNAPSNHVGARLADLDELTDEERATITNMIDALVTKAKLRLITGGAS